MTAWAVDIPIVSFLTDPQSFQSTVPSTVSTLALALALKASAGQQETTGGNNSNSNINTVSGRVINPITTPVSSPAVAKTATTTTTINPSPASTTNPTPPTSSSRRLLSLILSAAPFFYIFVFVPLLHLAAVGYLSTRHQRGGETAFAFLAQHLRSIGQSQREGHGHGHGQKANVAKSLLCRYLFDWHSPSCPFASPITSVRPSVAVLLLAPCHAFPGSSWLASTGMTGEWGGYDLRVYAPDCSPKEKKVEVVSSSISSSSATSSPPPPPSTSPPHDKHLTESAQFDQSPALFLRTPSGGPLSAVWSRYTPSYHVLS